MTLRHEILKEIVIDTMKYMYVMCVGKTVLEASRGKGAQSVIVKATGCGFDTQSGK